MVSYKELNSNCISYLECCFRHLLFMQLNASLWSEQQRALAFQGTCSLCCWHILYTVQCRNSTSLWIQHCVQETFLLGFYNCFSLAAQSPGSCHRPLSLPLSTVLTDRVIGACSAYCTGAHGWVARICQPWKQSLSRSWLSMVEAPGCFRHPTSILTMQLLIFLYCDHCTLTMPLRRILCNRFAS